jgi:transcriptional regulator
MAKPNYPPKPFRENRRDVLIRMINEFRLGLIVTAPDTDTFDAVHVPILVKQNGEKLFFESHVSKANPIWNSAEDRAALIVFQGPHAYVHPGWYETKKQNGKVVPTWNYISIQAHGRITAVSDKDWLRDHVDELSQTMEEGRAEPWSVHDAPEDYITGLLDGIVGLRIEVSVLEGIWKMSQNHPKANRIGVIEGLAGSDQSSDAAISNIMREIEAGRE